MSARLAAALDALKHGPPVPIVPLEPLEALGAANGPTGTNGIGGPCIRAPSLPGLADEWQSAFIHLDPGHEPCPGLRRWPAMHEVAARFLDEHGETAARLGWTTLELFAVHPIVGAVRLDCCGALMVPGGASATEVTHDAIRFDHLAHRRRPWPPGVTVVPVWDFRPGAPAGDRS